MNEIFIPFANIFSAFRSKIKGLYHFGYEIIHGATSFNQISSDQEKLAAVLANPACLKVFALQCDLFSMGKICVKDKEGKEIENDPILKLFENPNPYTKTQSQFLWDFMWWLMLGTDYCYADSKLLNPIGKRNFLYHLDPSKIEWPLDLERKKDKLIFSESELKAILKTELTYRYADGSTFKFPLEKLIISYDLTNGLGNFFKGSSRLDALYKIISNSEHLLDSENINYRYTGKFMVGSEQQTGTISKIGLGEEEKKDIIESMEKPGKNVYPVRAKVNVARFVENLANLNLTGEYEKQFFIICNMYNIPRDVAEIYNSSTYENQEKARAAHVNYTLDPKGNQFMDAFEVYFGYREKGLNIKITWDHLPFLQAFAKEAIDVKKTTVDILNSLLTMGVSIDQANEYLGTEFEIEKPQADEQAESGQGEAEEGDQNQAEETEGSGDSTQE